MAKPNETKPTEPTAAPATPSTTTAPAPTQATSSTATESTPAPGGAGVSPATVPAPAAAPQMVTMSKDDLTALVTGAVTSALAAQNKASETEEILATCQLAGCTAEQSQSYVDRKFTLAEVRQQLATQLNGKQTPPAQGTGAGDTFQKYRDAYEADRHRFEQAGITVDQFVKRRCQDDGVTPPAETK